MTEDISQPASTPAPDHDPAAARGAMRAHLSAVMDYLLFATEERAIEEARRTVASTRARYRATVGV